MDRAILEAHTRPAVLMYALLICSSVRHIALVALPLYIEQCLLLQDIGARHDLLVDVHLPNRRLQNRTVVFLLEPINVALHTARQKAAQRLSHTQKPGARVRSSLV